MNARYPTGKLIAAALAEGLIGEADVPAWKSGLDGSTPRRAELLRELEGRRHRAAASSRIAAEGVAEVEAWRRMLGVSSLTEWAAAREGSGGSTSPTTKAPAHTPWWDPGARSVADEVEDVLDEARREGRITLAAESGYRNRLYGADAGERRKILASIAQCPSGRFEPAERIPTPGDFRPAATAGVRAAATGGRPGASQDVAASLRASAGGAFVQASASGVSMPKAFGAGDLPPMTASGADPNLLGLLPWQARWAGARATRGQLAAMVNEYQGEFGDGLAAVHAMNGGPFYEDVRVYTAECSNWVMGAYEPGYNGPIFS